MSHRGAFVTQIMWAAACRFRAAAHKILLMTLSSTDRYTAWMRHYLVTIRIAGVRRCPCLHGELQRVVFSSHCLADFAMHGEGFSSSFAGSSNGLTIISSL
jgi:hypothetical protein